MLYENDFSHLKGKFLKIVQEIQDFAEKNGLMFSRWECNKTGGIKIFYALHFGLKTKDYNKALTFGPVFSLFSDDNTNHGAYILKDYFKEIKKSILFFNSLDIHFSLIDILNVFCNYSDDNERITPHQLIGRLFERRNLAMSLENNFNIHRME